LLPQVFARRERLLPAQWDSTAWEKAQGVELHPLARILAVEESGDEGSLADAPLLFVGEKLLDGRRRWQRLKGQGLDPLASCLTESVAEAGAFRVFLQKNVAARPYPAWRAAAGWLVVLCFFPDLAALKCGLAAQFPPPTDRKGRKGRLNVVKILARLCGVKRSTMASALASAAAFEADEFLDVLEGRQRTFYRAQRGQRGQAVEPRSRTELRHRVYGASEIRKVKKRQPDLAILCPDVSLADPMLSSDDRANVRMEELQTSLDYVLANFPQCRFAALFLPPQVVVTEHFKKLLESARENGCATAALASARLRAGVARQDVTHSWELVWVLSRAGPPRLHQPFTDALTPPPRVPAVLRSFCPPGGVVYVEGFLDGHVPSVLAAVQACGCKAVFPDYVIGHIREELLRA
jgi:hypothetical protein